MKFINIKPLSNYLGFLILLILVHLFFIYSSFACEKINFDRSVIWIENNKKLKRKFIVEIAETEDKRKQGLQCRKKLSKQNGMLFVWKDSNFRFFWMKNTFVSLDIIFINEKNKIFDIFFDAKPLSEKKIISKGKAKYVLELNSGEFERLNFKLGDRIVFDKKIKFFY